MSNTNGFEIVFENRKEIDDMLKGLPQEYQPRFMLGMLRYAIAPMVKAAQANAPISFMPHIFKFMWGKKWIQPGNLVDSIGIMTMRKAKTTTVIVGPQVKGKFKDEKGGFYGHWVEFGHMDRAGKMTRPKPFMRPAWDAHKDAVIKRFETDVKKRFDKYVKRLMKQGKMT